MQSRTKTEKRSTNSSFWLIMPKKRCLKLEKRLPKTANFIIYLMLITHFRKYILLNVPKNREQMRSSYSFVCSCHVSTITHALTHLLSLLFCSSKLQMNFFFQFHSARFRLLITNSWLYSCASLSCRSWGRMQFSTPEKDEVPLEDFSFTKSFNRFDVLQNAERVEVRRAAENQTWRR